MEPIFTKPELPRYSRRPLPPYRYLPGARGAVTPHPRAPGGHAYAQEDDYLPTFTPDDWRSCEPYRYGIDLFNHGYWWEAHEAWETVWLAAGQRSTVCGSFVQGLIQLAGAQLKRFVGETRGAVSLTGHAAEKLRLAAGLYLGIDVAALLAEAQRCLEEDRGEFPRIELHE